MIHAYFINTYISQCVCKHRFTPKKDEVPVKKFGKCYLDIGTILQLLYSLCMSSDIARSVKCENSIQVLTKFLSNPKYDSEWRSNSRN